MKRWLPFALILALTGAAPALFGDLHWRLVGPFRGGRALAVSGVPGNPNRFYFGSVDGGVWQSDNAGRTWRPIFDRQPIGSIGALAVAPSDPNVIYVGTGEADMRSDIAAGIGMYVSRDAGKTWTHAGLADSAQIGKIAVDPHDANVAYVAALGHQYGPNAQRGVFKTTDGGRTWNKVLFLNDDTGAIDVAMDPSDPQTVFASLWQTRRPPWNVYPSSSGPGSGIYVTHDGGAHWTHLTNGLPKRVERTGLSISANDPHRIYAIVDTGTDLAAGGVYRSDDGGGSWKRMAGGKAQERLWERGWYFGGITADPSDANVVYVMDTATYRSRDGGKSFVAIKGSPGGDDYHALWIDPARSSSMALAGDQGVVVTLDGGATWSSWLNQPTAQFYHIATDDRFPYWLYGAQQDSGAIAIPSRSGHAGISQFDWRPIDAGGESGSIAADPVEAARVFGSSPGLDEDLDSGAERTNDAPLGFPETIWRSTWTLPIAFSPVDRALYTTHQRIFRSRDKGRSWQIVSPDLTRPGTPRRGVVYAIAPSPLDARLLWAGTDDGFVWVTRDAGAHWKNVTPKALTAWSKIGTIEASHADVNVAYIAVDRHRLDDFAPYIYRTRDGGAHWTRITAGIPGGLAVNVVREDPQHVSLLYAGTERGMFVSFDSGNAWQSLQLDLPVTSVRDIAIVGSDVAIATHGRGFWILDDAASLRQIGPATASSALRLFALPPTYRVRPGTDQGTPIQKDEPAGANPPNGVAIDYWLRAAGPVVITVRDANGATVRRWSSTEKVRKPDVASEDLAPVWIAMSAVPAASAGSHRWMWNFAAGGDDGPLVPPGRYAITVQAAGTAQTQDVTLLRDPRLHATDADLRAQYALANAILAKDAIVKAAMKKAHTPEPADDPDNSVGSLPTDATSLTYLDGAYQTLEAAVASTDAAPTHDMLLAYAKLNAILAKRLSAR